MACKFGQQDVADLLIPLTDADRLSLNRSSLSSPIHLACRNKDEKAELVWKMLAKLRAASTPQHNYLEQALRCEDNTRNNLLHIAIKNNHLKIVEMLFNEFNADKESKDSKHGNYPIHSAAKNGSVPLLKILQKYDAVSFKPNGDSKNALHIAAETNSFNFIKGKSNPKINFQIKFHLIC